MKCRIVTGPRNFDLSKIFKRDDEDFIIGADQGALLLASNDIYFDLALGDFDSVTEKELELIKKHCENVKVFPEVKDYTDTYLAVEEAIDSGYDEIIIYGGIGGRLDHTFANINLLKLGNITIKTENEIVYILKPGKYNITNDMLYISFFALEDVVDLSLRQFEYQVDKLYLDTSNPLCISNRNEGEVEFKEGLLLVIHQNE
jgi:thiamine pyrophosphokinase